MAAKIKLSQQYYFDLVQELSDTPYITKWKTLQLIYFLQ
jgi:hypothetical protein